MARGSWPGGVTGGQQVEYWLPDRWKANSTGKVVIVLYGHLGTPQDWGPAQSGARYPWRHVRRFVEHGYAVVAADIGGVAWSSSAAMTALSNAVTWATSAGPVNATSPVLIFGYSMGGLTALNWIKRNPTLCSGAVLLNPATDLKWLYSLAGYTPPYSTSPYAGALPGQASWTSEIDTAYGTPFSTTTVGYRVVDEPASWQLSKPIKIWQGSLDNVLPPAASQFFVGQVNDPAVTWTSATGSNHTSIFADLSTDTTLAALVAISAPK